MKEDFFHVIDTEEKAYILGLLLTDGCVYDVDRVTLELKTGDRYVVDAFRDAVSPLRPVSERATSCRIDMRSRAMVEDLAALGVVPRKTFIASAPHIEDDLLRHFWRGCFDGDGGITQQRISISFCGALSLVQQCACEWARVAGKEPRIYAQGNIWYTRLHGNNAADVLEWMYRDATIAIPRKKAYALQARAHCRRKIYQDSPTDA